MPSSFREDEISYNVNLPTREFMYTVDQICLMLDVNKETLVNKILWFQGRSPGKPVGYLVATNIAAPDKKPVWRVSESAFRSWMRHKKIRFNDPEELGRRLKRSKR